LGKIISSSSSSSSYLFFFFFSIQLSLIIIIIIIIIIISFLFFFFQFHLFRFVLTSIYVTSRQAKSTKLYRDNFYTFNFKYKPYNKSVWEVFSNQFHQCFLTFILKFLYWSARISLHWPSWMSHVKTTLTWFNFKLKLDKKLVWKVFFSINFTFFIFILILFF